MDYERTNPWTQTRKRLSTLLQRTKSLRLKLSLCGHFTTFLVILILSCCFVYLCGNFAYICCHFVYICDHVVCLCHPFAYPSAHFEHLSGHFVYLLLF